MKPYTKNGLRKIFSILSSVSALWPLHESQTQDNLEFNPLGLAFWSI
ncbi:hypothetical protein [Leptospira interrogans]|nr:hypothetical protein [Leptospira interrogans]